VCVCACVWVYVYVCGGSSSAVVRATLLSHGWLFASQVKHGWVKRIVFERLLQVSSRKVLKVISLASRNPSVLRLGQALKAAASGGARESIGWRSSQPPHHPKQQDLAPVGQPSTGEATAAQS
jgi:hypothetical protein